MTPALGFVGEGMDGAQPRSGAPVLPCLNSNKCNGDALKLPPSLVALYGRLTTNHRKTAFKLSKSVARLCGKYGVERIGFLTLTFADHVTCARVAGRRFHSLRTGVLRHRYGESICVLERMKSGRIHFHLLVVLAVDIRTGFNFEEAARGVYSSANQYLRGEWAFWRKTAKLYGFGRSELLPVKSNDEALSKYVGKYIAKHVGAREGRDKGVRLVRYSEGASIGSNAFMFVSRRSRLWRWQVSEFARRNGCEDLGQLRGKFGRRWAYLRRSEIIEIKPPPGQMADTFIKDRAERIGVLANVCENWGEATAVMDGLRPVLTFTVPAFSGVCIPRVKDRENWETTIIWNDRVETG